MKKTLLGLIAIVLFSLNGNAQQNGSDQRFEFIYGSVITTFNKEIIEYRFKSLEELNGSLDEITKDFDFDKKEKACEIKIEVKIELTSGKTKILISEVINTSCDNESLSAATNRLKSMTLATTS